MVAPTRAPQSRGVKCDLCKTILLKATWLDQTKPAKTVKDAEFVLNLIDKHGSDGCLCMPKNIENLLVGSTHFEIHRIVAKQLDNRVHFKQCERFNENIKQARRESQSSSVQIVNDCKLDQKTSRFKIAVYQCDAKYHEITKQQLDHLIKSIKAWCEAVEDQANPFNSKLALRLGLTHHTVYACYYFKYYHLLDLQLQTANLLLNLFRSIEGVTANAILHANYLLVKTLIDCDQLKLARQYLTEATKIANYHDKTHYESILLTCVSCELSILDGSGDQSDSLSVLAEEATIRPEDKLQHYYSRTYAMTVILRYLHYFKTRSDLCFEFFHTYRYICAIIRRCYESSFELVLSEKEPSRQQSPGGNQTQILDHSWIRFAVCDLVFSTLDLLANFYSRAGIPESLELLLNGLDLIAYRNGSYFWQCKLASISAGLDILCSKYDHAQSKLDIMSKVVGYANDKCLMNLLRLEVELSTCEFDLEARKETNVSKNVFMGLLERIRSCLASHEEKLAGRELYDFLANSRTRLSSMNTSSNEFIVLGRSLDLRKYSLRLVKTYVATLYSANKIPEGKDELNLLSATISATERQVLEFYECHLVLEAMLYCCDITESESKLLDAVSKSKHFLTTDDNLTAALESIHISERTSIETKQGGTRKRNAKTSRLTKNGCLNKATYKLGNSGEILCDTVETLKNFKSLTVEEILLAYLKNTAPCPDYLIYRKVHELLFSICLLDHDARSAERLLYHFLESNTSNSMRYRWMMFEEQQSGPHDRPTSDRCDLHVRQLGFNFILADCDKIPKSLVKHIPDEWLLLQIKHIQDKESLAEHLLIVCIDGSDTSQPIYVHSKRAVTAPDDFFDSAAEVSQDNYQSRTLPDRMLHQISESRKVLLSANNKSRIELRQKIENEMSSILLDLESECLGPFRFLLCGKSHNSSYNKFVQNLMEDILTILNGYNCNSRVALKLALQNAPLISRDEFFVAISAIFDCPPTSRLVRDCYDGWLKSIESFLADDPALGNSKRDFMQTIARGQVGLMLDKSLDHIPFESLPVVRTLKQGIFRVPSLRILNAIQGNLRMSPLKVRADKVAYILDPASNLNRTRDRFDSRLRQISDWVGAINKPPKTEDLDNWLSAKDIYIFIGHGAGSVYYNKLNKNRGLHTMPSIKPVSIVMGCSSGRVQAEGPNLEPFGINWAFVFRGSPCYLGLLWDVTDTDIDRFLDNLLEHWIGHRWSRNDSGCASLLTAARRDKMSVQPITDACARAKHSCQLKYLVGSTPVVFGLPMICTD